MCTRLIRPVVVRIEEKTVAKTPRRAEKVSARSDKGKGASEAQQQELDPAQEALFREVEEDLRAEQMHRLWKQYSSYVIGAAALVVVVVAGFQGWTAWQASVRAAEAERYFTAVAVEGGDQAALVALGQDGRTGYAGLARLQHANALAAAGDTAGAIGAYDSLSSDGSAPKPVRDLAAMLAALRAIDVEDAATLRGRLAPLSADESPWRFMALEVLGTLNIRAGDTVTARQIFSTLAGEREAPPGVRARASEFLTLLGESNEGQGGGEGQGEDQGQSGSGG